MPLSPPAQPFRCPSHPESLTPAQARRLAIQLVELADDAEGGGNAHGFVTRMDFLLRLQVLEDQYRELLADR